MFDRQSLAALRAASLQNCPAVLCRHPRPEPVLFRAAAVVWLISSLRHSRTPCNSPESENLEFKGRGESCQKQFDTILDRLVTSPEILFAIPTTATPAKMRRKYQ